MLPILIAEFTAHDFFHWLTWAFRIFLLFSFLCLLFRIGLWVYRKLVLFFSWIFYSFSALPSDRVEAYVTRVVDGDTFFANIVNEDDSLSEINVRFYHIDTPETNQSFGPEATALLRNLVENRTVVLTCMGIDTYGRVLADVFRGGVDVQLEMVKQGYGWVQDAPDTRSARLYRAFLKAQANQAGIWSEPAPIQPKAFRATNN